MVHSVSSIILTVAMVAALALFTSCADAQGLIVSCTLCSDCKASDTWCTATCSSTCPDDSSSRPNERTCMVAAQSYGQAQGAAAAQTACQEAKSQCLSNPGAYSYPTRVSLTECGVMALGTCQAAAFSLSPCRQEVADGLGACDGAAFTQIFQEAAKDACASKAYSVYPAHVAGRRRLDVDAADGTSDADDAGAETIDDTASAAGKQQPAEQRRQQPEGRRMLRTG